MAIQIGKTALFNTNFGSGVVDRMYLGVDQVFGTPFTPVVLPDANIIDLDFSNASCYPGSGTTVTDLYGGFTGTLENSPTYDAVTGSFYFNLSASNQRISFPGSGTRYEIPPSGSATWNIWCSKQSNADNTLIVKGPLAGSGTNYPGNYELSSGFNLNTATMLTEKAGGINFSLPTTNYFFGNATNEWVLWTITSIYDSGTNTYNITHYKNGALWLANGLDGAGGFISVPAEPLRIGSRKDNNPWKGRVADVKIYDLALTTDEITLYFDNTKARFGL